MPTFPVLDGDATVACNRYNAIASRLVSASFPTASRRIKNLASIRDEIDVYVLDGYGVLNIGPHAIPGAVDRVHELQEFGATVLVLTNGSTLPATQTLQKYLSLGLPLTAEQVVSSRDGLIVRLKDAPTECRWGVMAPENAQAELLATHVHSLADDPADYESADGFILLSSDGWSDSRQQLLIDAVRKKQRPVLVGNPDLVAPFADLFSLEPGWYAHDLFDQTNHEPEFFGKPFGNVFELIKQKIGAIDPSRVAMVGDTLHTDILGGAAAGFKTVLISGHGLLRGLDVEQAIVQARIRPDFIAPDP
jgi:HAD superfamily hydrolase (TIGR01450 family)